MNKGYFCLELKIENFNQLDVYHSNRVTENEIDQIFVTILNK